METPKRDIDCEPQSHRERCLYWSRIFAMRVRGKHLKAVAVDATVAAALIVYAECDPKTGERETIPPPAR